MATIYENLEQLISTKKSIKQILEVYSTDTIND
jgi:surface protein